MVLRLYCVRQTSIFGSAGAVSMPNDQRLQELQEEYAKTKYNKATDKYLGILRAKIAKVKAEMREKKRKKGVGYAAKKSGDATVVLVGPPNVGKSSLLKCLTNAETKVANYAFTTIDVIPGMLNYDGVLIQMLDLPGLIEGAHIGRGGGRKIASVIRIADMALFVVDPATYMMLPDMVKELEDLGIMVNKKRKSIKVEELKSGGITVEKNGHKAPSDSDIKEILSAFGIYNANVIFFDDANEDDLISALSGNRVFLKGMVVLNKIDTVNSTSKMREMLRSTGMDVVETSAQNSENIGELEHAIFSHLELIRVYLKPKLGSVDLNKPLVLKRGASVADAARKAHNKKLVNVKSAYVTGKSVRFAAQKVGLDHILEDGDVVTFV